MIPASAVLRDMFLGIELSRGMTIGSCLDNRKVHAISGG
jgi:hypothetical protein